MGKRFDSKAFSQAVTNSVTMWVLSDEDPDPGAFVLERYGRREVARVAADAESLAEAGEAIRGWFTDRLTVDPGVPGPFCNLSYDLINAALDLVDWDEVAASFLVD